MSESLAPSNPVLESLLSIPKILGSRISGARNQLAFTTNTTGRFEVHALSLSDGQLRQLTHGELPLSPVWGFVWSPDATEIIFGKDENGDELHDLFRLRADGGQLEQLTNDRTCVRYPMEFSPDRNWLIFTCDKGQPGEPRQPDLWRLPLSGGAAQRLTHHAQPVYPYFTRNTFSPDSRQITYAASDSSDPHDLGVYVANADGSRSELVFSGKTGSRDRPAGWDPAGTRIALSSDAFDRVRTGILDVRSREVRWMGPQPYDEIPVEFSPDGRRLLVLRTTGVQMAAVVYDLGSGGATVSPFCMSFDGDAYFGADGRSVVAIRTSSSTPNEIVLWNSETGASRTLWSPRLGNLRRESFIPGQVVHYPTFDGRDIEALLYEPARSGSDRRGPAIVVVHGGPTWQWFDEFEPVCQFLASQGFVLILPNIRGSMGYGAAFRDLNLMDLGGGDLQDVVAAAHYLGSLPNVDSSRVGITGISYGGYMTFQALTRTPEVWAAGCAEAGITDWLAGYELESPALQHLDRVLLGDPVQNAALWKDRSPLYFADRMRAPLLIIHSTHDPRCPIVHARLFRDALLRLGRREGQDFEYLEYTDEGHSSHDIQQQMRSVVPMVRFFRRHLMGPEGSNPDGPT